MSIVRRVQDRAPCVATGDAHPEIKESSGLHLRGIAVVLVLALAGCGKVESAGDAGAGAGADADADVGDAPVGRPSQEISPGAGRMAGGAWTLDVQLGSTFDQPSAGGGWSFRGHTPADIEEIP